MADAGLYSCRHLRMIIDAGPDAILRAGVPAPGLAAAYHERWETGQVHDEVKTHQRGPTTVLRSRKPEMAEQEIWGLLLARYGIRHLMREAADQAELDPGRLSFIRALRVVRRPVSNQAAFPPQKLRTAAREAIDEIVERLDPERRDRSCPRKAEENTTQYVLHEATD